MKKRFLFLLTFLSIFCLLLTSCGGDGNQSEEISGLSEDANESKSEASEDSIGYENAEMSAELFDFTLKIDGTVYKLPIIQKSLISNGFAVTQKGSENVKPSFVADGVVSKGETTLSVQVINPTKDDLAFENCPVGRISYDFSGTAEIFIADNFPLKGATKNAIMEKFGDPEQTETHSDFSEITYGSRKTAGNYAKYLFRFDKNGNIVYFSIVNHYMPK